MSRAEEKALEKYPAHSVQIVPARGGGYYADSHLREGFIEGYHQAEKDLDVVSWIKEISGVKDMSRAKEEALKAYPPRSIAANYDTIARRDAFEFGYLKAEKDNELSWEDMRELHIIFAEIDVAIDLRKTNIKTQTHGYYQEVLKRFKERKEK